VLKTETFDLTRKISEDLLKSGYNVATNKKNTIGLPVFHSKGVGNSVPDLFIWEEKYENEIFDEDFTPKEVNHIRAAFIELKTGEKSGDLIDAIFQNTRYYSYFVTNKAIISIDNNIICNVDSFLVATRWSPTGMLYKGDEDLPSRPIPYISERYNILFKPITQILHALQRKEQKRTRLKILNNKLVIPTNKTQVQTGIMHAKIPYDESKISYEYYAWIGNKILPLQANSNNRNEYIQIKLKIHRTTEKAVYAETRLNKFDYFPKSVLKFHKKYENIDFNKWYDFGIARWFYHARASVFGIS
jgi:hypothetical protein